MTGIGMYISASGNVYEGEWLNDKRHGKGKQVKADGSWCEGTWTNNLMNGKFRRASGPNSTVTEEVWNMSK